LFLRILRYTSIHATPLLYGILTFHAINKTSILYMFHVKQARLKLSSVFHVKHMEVEKQVW